MCWVPAGRGMRLLLCAGWESLLGYLRKVRNYSWEPLFSPCGCSQASSISSSFQFAQKLLCARGRGQAGSGYVTLSGQWSAHELWHLPSPRAGHSGHSSGTHLRVQGHTSQGRESWQRSVSFTKWFSKRNRHEFIFPCLPTGCYFRSSATCWWKGGSSCVHLGDCCARMVKFAKLRLEFRGRKEQREEVTEPCWEWMVTPSTILITCFGLLASLCSLGNCA